MAIVVDAAREDKVEDNMRYLQTHAAAAETHVGRAYETPVNNTADAWPPLVTSPNENVIRGGDFSSGFEAWPVNAGWEEVAGGAYIDGTQGVGTDLFNVATAQTGEVFEVTFTIEGRTNGSVAPRIGAVSGTSRSTDGTYTEQVTAAADDVQIGVRANGTFEGTIKNVIARKLG